MKTTKKDFINTLCEDGHGHVFVYSPTEIEEKTILLLLKVWEGKTWHKDDPVRYVTKRGSNHLEFSNGSRLYFDSYAKRSYERWDGRDCTVLCMHIREKGVPEAKHLYYIIRF